MISLEMMGMSVLVRGKRQIVNELRIEIDC